MVEVELDTWWYAQLFCACHVGTAPTRALFCVHISTDASVLIGVFRILIMRVSPCLQYTPAIKDFKFCLELLQAFIAKQFPKGLRGYCCGRTRLDFARNEMRNTPYAEKENFVYGLCTDHFFIWEMAYMDKAYTLFNSGNERQYDGHSTTVRETSQCDQ